MARPDKYRRVGLAPAQGIDGITDQTLFSQENFRRWDFTKVGAPQEIYTIGPGVIHRFNLPATATKHHFWIASGAHYHGVSTDFWMVQGCLNFYRSNRPVGCYLFGDADQQSAGIASQQAVAKREIIRNAPDGSGSPLTILRFQRSIAVAVRNNLDIGCAVIPVMADRAEFEVQVGRVEFNAAAGSQISILTGARVISIP